MMLVSVVDPTVELLDPRVDIKKRIDRYSV